MKKFLFSSIFYLVLTVFSQAIQAQEANWFKRFKLMDIPRSEVPIGAVWTSQGPMGKGAEESSLNRVTSFSQYNSNKNSQFKADLELTLLKFITGKFNLDRSRLMDLKVDSIEIVNVEDLNVLKSQIGKKILFEAIRVKQMTVTFNSRDSLNLDVKLNEFFEDINVSNENKLSKKKEVTAQGGNLYIAYNVVELKREKTKVEKVKFKPQFSSGTSGLRFISRYYFQTDGYTITLCPCDILKCAQNTMAYGETASTTVGRCVLQEDWEITVLNSNKFSDGQPAKSIIRTRLPYDIWNKSFPLTYDLTSEGFIVDYLNIEHLYLEPNLLNFNSEKPTITFLIGDDERVKIVKEKVIFKNVSKDLVW